MTKLWTWNRSSPICTPLPRAELVMWNAGWTVSAIILVLLFIKQLNTTALLVWIFIDEQIEASLLVSGSSFVRELEQLQWDCNYALSSFIEREAWSRLYNSCEYNAKQYGSILDQLFTFVISISFVVPSSYPHPCFSSWPWASVV